MAKVIDGSQGEGGGQVLRMSVALAALTGEEVVIENIRRGRPKPGLARQHLAGLEAAGRMCNARLEGAAIGSSRVSFRPGELVGGRFSVDIGTAGAITLVLQTLCPLALRAEKPTEIRIRGGTDVAWSPPADYFRDVFLHHLRMMGGSAEFEVLRRGFYPKGGGEATFRESPGTLRGLDLSEPSGAPSVSVKSIATENLMKPRVAERQADAFRRELSREVDATIEYVASLSAGSVLHAVASTSATRYGANALGKKGLPAEKVGRRAAQALQAEIEAGVTVDTRLADQLLIYASIARGPTVVRTREVTGHTATMLDLIPRFLDVEFGTQKEGETTLITCEGA